MTHLSEDDSIIGKYSVVAETVNIAYRLSAAAGPDEILVSDFSLGSDRHLFNLSDTRILNVEGIEGVIETLCVVGRAPLPSRYHSRVVNRAEWIGRATELATLHDRFKAATSGRVESISEGVLRVVERLT